MTKVTRQLVHDGNTHEVSHAVCADGSSPSLDAMTEMGSGSWEEDPDHEATPDDAQISQAQKLLAGIEFFADHGYPRNNYCRVNNLDQGIWEFKLGSVRVSFFDTDGSGGFTPKLRITDIRDAEFDGDFWWLPGFDEYIRLGHCFGKNSQRTAHDDLMETQRVREEDVQHDRA